MGISFQIIDDILGLIGEQDKLGKPIGSDLREGKKTYLLLYAFENLEQEDKETLNEILGYKKKSDDEINEALSLIKKSGALEKAKELAENHIGIAIDNLSHFPDSDSKTELINLAELTIDRNY